MDPSPGSALSMDFTEAGLSMMAIEDAAATDFDYGAFLQEQDVDYLAEESSASSHTLSDPASAQPAASSSTQALVRKPAAGTITTTTANASPSASAAAAQAKQRMERRGHTKSRRGCYNCKRRRIKCQETRPACGHCVKTGLKCEYPTMPVVVHQPQHQIPLFSLQDMRFFQHFLFQCYPHHPIGAENVWTHEIPCLSQKYEYLMHAILGYAASELISEDPSLRAPAMAHRLKAVKAIKRTLSDVPKANTFEEGNALMATCYALTFQSVLLDDGMAEYMTFIRGIVIVAIQMYIKGSSFLFGNFLGDRQNEILEPLMAVAPKIDRSWTDAAVNAVRNLEPLCSGLPVERKYYDLILNIAENNYESAWKAYKGITDHYGWWIMLPHDQFQRLIDPTNQVAVLLASHWISLKQIMVTITSREGLARAKQPPKSADHDMDVGIVRWLRYLNRSVDADHVGYNVWPLWVEAQLDRDPTCFGRSC